MPNEFYLTILLFVKTGEEENFLLYEEKVLPILERYDGQLLYRIRPDRQNFITAEDYPYEVHLVSFRSREDFERYREDEERNSYSHLFRQSVQKVILVEGEIP